MKDTVSVVVINWNNKSYIKRCIDSIIRQTFKNIELIFIDNNSSDDSYEYFCKEYPNENFIKVNNDKNLGYSGAANQGINMAHGEYVMIINPDIVMESDFVEKLYIFTVRDEEIAAVSGKLLKYDFKNDKKLNYIDSAGIEMFRSRRCIDRGQNQEDIGQYDTTEQIFGVCGAAPFYRKSALEKVRIENEYFDEDFFAYKEDIDLSWRFNLAGLKCMYYPKAIAYHGRGFGKGENGIKNYINARKKQSKFIRGLSFRNQYLMILKNETKQTFKRDKWQIIKNFIKFLMFSLIFEPFNLKSIKEILSLKNKMKLKHKAFEDKVTMQCDFIDLIKS
ncbi:glycosyltransferase family 2 protein [Clostridium sp. CM028]|uniref:glycosyltransferase family 2 protein n=1 Tax=unclassified Clostridium TaxID=2614128 RepID=UPI001C0C301F|nr:MULTISPECIES: glycosyltransferase family 2 protein [unclassified Clostridium]MBU3091662.1 glycosyltransferase family 2 protein [Clostridium sp. CF011]MBW9144836.1 glycosyltransferase family 2 protein [Clostridium sp. CM027]MBW9149304.1 glycosyltransferase family 2 protein [Clostridium sp. CM028]UVE40421.1 glycosyltransferase family 2 protein [Clostridium sp. CM027]WAG69374.1 glycosyltransferase family 2 protein [Clostridium sp. CF011]